MIFLTPEKIYNKNGLVIKEKILPASLKPNRKLSGGTGKAEYITVHNTPDINEAAGTNDAEQYARATFNGAMGGVSVHYYLDETDCWHILHDDEVGYHAADGKYGPGNNTSIAIEIIMDGSGSKADKEAEDRGALLAAILLHENGLGIERLTTHNRWYSKKYCPAYILPHWEKFKEKVENNLFSIQNPKKEPIVQNLKTGEKYILQAGAFSKNAKAKAEAFVESIKKKGFDAYVLLEDEYYKVRVGTFTVKPYMLDYKAKLEKAGIDVIIKIMKDTPNESDVVKGDVDGDGKVTASDARLILRSSVGLEEVPTETGDIDGDGKVTAADAREALKISVGLEE